MKERALRRPQPADVTVELLPGAHAIAPGLLWLSTSRTLVAADAHFGYEDVIGGALPTWSTTETVTTLLAAAHRLGAHEIIMLGDVIHGSRMSEGAARAVIAALDLLRTHCTLTLVAGNHEGRTRGAAVLGETFEHVERDGWLLLHGDRLDAVTLSRSNGRAIIGHLHPSLHVGGGVSAPAFLAGSRVIVVPALTPYSPGLDVCSEACLQALAPLGVTRRDLHVTVATADRVVPFGTLSELRRAIARPSNAQPRNRFRRNVLRPD
ncbi:MAG: metallophosphoesterase [Vulcanimicrobiaceae bacterium]